MAESGDVCEELYVLETAPKSSIWQRATWIYSNITQNTDPTAPSKPAANVVDQSFRLLSAFRRKNDRLSWVKDVDGSYLPRFGQFMQVNFISSSYRIVFSFDVSPSMAAVVC